MAFKMEFNTTCKPIEKFKKKKEFIVLTTTTKKRTWRVERVARDITDTLYWIERNEERKVLFLFLKVKCD